MSAGQETSAVRIEEEGIIHVIQERQRVVIIRFASRTSTAIGLAAVACFLLFSGGFAADGKL
jgi:hypothetical protein